MTQESKIEFIISAIAAYYKTDVSCITAVRKSDPNYILRWLCCYFLRKQLKLKYREIAAIIYSNTDPSHINAICDKLEIKMMHSRELRMTVNYLKLIIEEKLTLMAA